MFNDSIDELDLIELDFKEHLNSAARYFEDKYDGSEFLQRLCMAVLRSMLDANESHLKAVTVSFSLNVSERTLYRRIKEKGKTYMEIKDEVRMTVARSLLKTETYTIYQVSCLLLYRDPSHFTQSFKRWHGATPKKWSSNSPL